MPSFSEEMARRQHQKHHHDDQATLRVNQNSANIEQSVEIYIYEIMNDASWLTAMAVDMDSRRRFLKRWHVADAKNFAGHDQATLRVNQNSANIVQPVEIYV